jgi:hypothetical protein
MALIPDPLPPRTSVDVPTGVGGPSWQGADGPTWRGLARGLLELDLRRLYRREGYESTAHYAECELGLTPQQTAELLRICRKLLDLPEIDRAFCNGWLTWQQVVVVTRVAVPEHEAAWLDRALEVPVGELTGLVDRSAEGWAPPEAWDRRAHAGEAPSGSIAARFDAMSWSWHAYPVGDRILVGFGREDGAPNDRQAPGASFSSA